MTFEEFDILTDLLLGEVRLMRDTKGKEYTDGLERFDNFNRLAAELDLPRLKVWQVYFTKHMDAIRSYIRTGQTHSTEPIRGRIVDAITYLTLLAGMIEEDIQKEYPVAHSLKVLDECIAQGLPSAADLDAVAGELSAKESTLGVGRGMIHEAGGWYRTKPDGRLSCDWYLQQPEGKDSVRCVFMTGHDGPHSTPKRSGLEGASR